MASDSISNIHLLPLPMEFTPSLLLLLLLPLLFLLLAFGNGRSRSSSSKKLLDVKIPPLLSPLVTNQTNRWIQWTSDLIQQSPNATYVSHHLLGRPWLVTGSPDVVQHILKNNFLNYEKGDLSRATFADMLGDGILNADGDSWKSQRQVASHEFNTKSLRKFMETVVDKELNDRLIPFLSEAARKGTVFDMQDILQRFAFDTICQIAFGHDPECLLSSLPDQKFAQAFDEAANISNQRFFLPFPLLWKIKGMLNIDSEKRLRMAVSEVREFARKIIREKKQEQLKGNLSDESEDLLSRFLSTNPSDEEFLIDIVICFTFAGRDTSSAALTWYFWTLSKNPHVENEVLREIKEKSEMPIYDDVKDMVYTHASVVEIMRLYPPLPLNSRESIGADVLPDGTVIKKGTRITYSPYAMGRSERIWGPDWADFKPERWLDEKPGGKRAFVRKDPSIYPVFHAGPRICLGRDQSILQIKRVIAGVLRQFKVVPMIEHGVEPSYTAHVTAKMVGGFPVMIKNRFE